MFTQRLVHLDLKGAAPRPRYLQAIFPLLRQWGATGLCIEWEDRLPFSGRLEVLRHPQGYTRRQVAEILAAAGEAGLEVVPLVQTFGHLEFVLKHACFAALREDPDSAHDLCPLHPDAPGLMRELIDQTLALHPGVQTVHLGGDEVRALGANAGTARAIAAHGRAPVYRAHMLPLIEHVCSRGVRALIWDDMLRAWPVEELRPLAGKAGLVVWRYGADIGAGLPPGMWDRYREAGVTIWGASAFKGACGEDAIWLDAGTRVRNHTAWLACAGEREMVGLILTGWSRYNHFSALCELLPTALPALALCLAVLNRGGFDDSLRRESFVALGIGDMPFEHTRTEDIIALPTGSFPGADVFRLAGKLQGARQLMWFVNDDMRFRFPKRNGGRADAGLARQVIRRSEWAERIAAEVAAELPAALRGVLFPADVQEFMRVQVRQLIASARQARAAAEKVSRVG